MALGDTWGEIKRAIRDRPDLYASGSNVGQIYETLKNTNPALYERMLNEFALESPRPFEKQAMENELTRELGFREEDLDRKRKADEYAKTQADNEAKAKTQAEQDALVQQEVARRTQSNLNDAYNRIYGQMEEAGTNSINRDYGAQRKKQIEEEAALGRLRSPASIVPLSRIDDSRQNALSNFIASLNSQRAEKQYNLASTLEQLLQNRDINNQELGFKNKSLGESARQFNDTLNLQQQRDRQGQINYDSNVLRQNALINAQKEASESSLWDKIDKGLGTANNFLKLGDTAFDLGKKISSAGNSAKNADLLTSVP